MIYTIRGKVSMRGDSFAVVECGGVGFKVLTTKNTLGSLTQSGEVLFYCFFHVRENLFELYGFHDERTLKLFEMFNSVSGVGPKTALNLLDLDSIPNIMAAIIEKRPDFLTRSSGVGKKTAERVVLELSGKLKLEDSKEVTERMSIDVEVEGALVSLGYDRREARRILSTLEGADASLEVRLRAALKALAKH